MHSKRLRKSGGQNKLRFIEVMIAGNVVPSRVFELNNDAEVTILEKASKLGHSP